MALKLRNARTSKLKPRHRHDSPLSPNCSGMVRPSFVRLREALAANLLEYDSGLRVARGRIFRLSCYPGAGSCCRCSGFCCLCCCCCCFAVEVVSSFVPVVHRMVFATTAVVFLLSSVPFPRRASARYLRRIRPGTSCPHTGARGLRHFGVSAKKLERSWEQTE